jgi:1,4-alpha-glucan branching enzyme
MNPQGTFTFVLHSHLPYARQAGRWPHGEEWLHEAAAETYVPLLDALYRLRAEQIPFKLTISLTPILLEQLADADIQANFSAYLHDRIEAARGDVLRFEQEPSETFAELARYYLDWYEHTREQFENTYRFDLVSAFKVLQDEGYIEIITCAATHAYLPLLDRDESINLQLATAIHAYERHFGRKPRAIWLPECAYRPAYMREDGTVRHGLEDFLQADGIELFFAETHMIEGGRPVGVAAGEVSGPYGDVMRRYLVPFSDVEPSQPATTFHPYLVGESSVAVIGRNNKTGLQVWSADWGYPGDFDYREFHKKDSISGLQYWRVTGAGVGLDRKEPYNPDWAAGKVERHANHFAHLVRSELEKFAQETGEPGLISANFDTELFGHWWFEGVAWLEAVLRKLAAMPAVELDTAIGYLEHHPPQTALNLPEGSWGAGGNHFVWDNEDTRWMWPIVHAAEGRFHAVLASTSAQAPWQRSTLNQAARELLLLQSSDWPFLVTTGQAREYAAERFRTHAERFHTLLDGLEKGEGFLATVELMWEKDKIFPELDSGWFTA